MGSEPECSTIERAAMRGAQSVTNDPQMVRDAAIVALERWEDALVSGKSIRDAHAYVARVAANAAKRLAVTRKRTVHLGLDSPAIDAAAASTAKPTSDHAEEAGQGPQLDVALPGLHQLLRGRQAEVMQKLLLPDMSIRRAAC